MLDLVLSSLGDERIEVHRGAAPVVAADAYHPPLAVCVKGARPVPRRIQVRSDMDCEPAPSEWNFRKADFPSLYACFASTDWDDLYNISDDVNVAVSTFYEKISICLDKYVPYKQRGNNSPRYQYPTWFTADIIRNIKLKYYHLKKFKELQLEFNEAMFKYYRTRVKELIDLAYTSYINQTEMDIKNNPKKFWQFVQEQQSTKQTQDEYEYEGNVVSGKNAANAFAHYFKSVFLNTDPLLSAAEAEREAASAPCSARIAIDSVCTRDLRSAVQRLKPHTSAGPDGIPPFLVKDCFNVFKLPLQHIFNLALSTATYPSRWKISRVTPIPKDSSGSNVVNYRPIAVLSAFGKLFESILNYHITRQINTQLSDAQHGFRAGRSTVTNHVNFIDYAVNEMDNKKQVDTAYFDFRKAFDRVHNDVLLRKFSEVGFTPKLLSLFANYFLGRVQYVQLAGHRSDPYSTSSGVSQGSTLGPTQFLIMINDLPSAVRSARCLMFADDLKLFMGVGNSADCEALQRDIDSVVKWSEQNLLEFNASKCKCITFTRSRSPISWQYSIHDTPLERVERIRDLGLTLDTELTFNAHITELCARASKALGFVMRQASRFHQRSTIVTLYYAFVRSILEYNSIVWDPHEAKYKVMIERVQRKFNRFLYKKLYGYYPTYIFPSLFVAGMVGIDTLELRRKCAIIMHYYTLLNNKGVDNPTALSRVSLITSGVSLRPHVRRLLAAPPVRTDTAKYAPTSQAVALLNALISQKPDADLFYMNPYVFYKYCIAYLNI